MWSALLQGSVHFARDAAGGAHGSSFGRVGMLVSKTISDHLAACTAVPIPWISGVIPLDPVAEVSL